MCPTTGPRGAAAGPFASSPGQAGPKSDAGAPPADAAKPRRSGRFLRSRSALFLGAASLLLLLGIVQLWSLRTQKVSPRELDADDAGWYYNDNAYGAPKQKKGHLPVQRQQHTGRSRKGSGSGGGSSSSSKESSDKTRVRHQLEPGQHVWVVSIHDGATLQHPIDGGDSWRVETDSGGEGTVIVPLQLSGARDTAGEVNIVPFLSPRQRIMQSRLKALLQVRAASIYHEPPFQPLKTSLCWLAGE